MTDQPTAGNDQADAPDDAPEPVRARPVRDRDVLISALLVIAGVLIFARVTGLVPALDDAIGLEPLVIVGLIVVTIAVLFVALRPRRS